MTKVNGQFDTVIVGLGKTGLSCARYMAGENANFAIADNRSYPPMLDQITATLPHVPLYLGKFDRTLLANANNLIVSPGISLREDAIAHAIDSGTEAYGDIELFCRNISVPIMAITGTNGKSTVTTLVTEMLRAANTSVISGGNLSTPVLDMLAMPPPDLYVLELSSFQLETVKSLNAVSAVVLNIAPDHMDRHQNMNEYIDAKERIYNGTGTMVINADDPIVAKMRKAKRNCISITLTESTTAHYSVGEYDNVPWIVKGQEKLIPIDDIKIKGKHNIANAIAAIALAESVNCPLKNILHVLRTFTGLAHRCEFVFEHANITWVNDSKGTNVAASCAAIENLSNGKNIILLAGGNSKGTSFLPLKQLAQTNLKGAIVFGKDGAKIATALQYTIPVHHAETIEIAVETAADMAKSGDIILLSPACSSNDMFADYQERGTAFVEAIKKKLQGNDAWVDI